MKSSRLVLLTVFLNIITPYLVHASPTELVGRSADGPVYASVKAGDLLYSGAGGKVRIFKGPQTWKQVGEFQTPGIVRDLATHNSALYVADDNGAMRSYDISSSSKPVAKGVVKLEPFVRAITLNGNYAYLANGWSGVAIVDITQPFSPKLTNTLGSLGYIIDVYAYKTLMLAIARSGMHVLDISDPQKPVKLAKFKIEGEAHGVYALGDKAYIVSLEKNGAPKTGGLTIVDIADPKKPKLLSFMPLKYGAERLQVQGNYAYLAGVANDAGLIIVDISNSQAPKKLGSYKHPTCSESVVVDEKFAYLAHGDMGLEIIDITKPMSPYVYQHFDANGHARGIMVNNQNAFIANGYTGLRILDVSNKSEPLELANIKTYRALDVRVIGKYAYVADDWAGLKVIDISNPVTPKKIGELNTPGYAEGIDVVNTHAFIADGESGLRMINVANPQNPVEISHIDTPGYAYTVNVKKDIAYLAAGRSGLRIISIDQNQLSELSHFVVKRRGFDVRDVFIQGNTAYLATNVGGVSIVNIANPKAPVEIGSFTSIGTANSIRVSDNLAYVGTRNGVEILDVKNPSQPKLLRSVNTPGDAHRLWLTNKKLYVAAREAGLLILKTSDS